MEREEVLEVLEQYGDANSEKDLISLLKEKLIEEMESWEANTERQRHDLNLVIRDIEEELDYIESEKLTEFDPESS